MTSYSMQNFTYTNNDGQIITDTTEGIIKLEGSFSLEDASKLRVGK